MHRAAAAAAPTAAIAMAAALTATAAPATITAAAVVTAATAAVPRVITAVAAAMAAAAMAARPACRSANLPAPRVIPTPARRPRPAPRASMMGMILTCSARSNCKIQRKISIWKKSSVFAMRQKKRCSFCTDKNAGEIAGNDRTKAVHPPQCAISRFIPCCGQAKGRSGR